jgi:ferredoxin--NADP+ reductase
MARLLGYNATIAERVDLTDALAIFRVEPDDRPERPWFKAGQYCVIGLNDNTPPVAAVRRPMSIASAPEDDGPIEFYIRRISSPTSKSPLTHLLWRCKRGDRLYLRTVAAGVFTIDDTIGAGDERLRVMVAAGTGIAPFISMLRSELRRDPHGDLSRWAVLHGASHPNELAYRDEFLAMSRANGLHYLPTVSRPGEWTGHRGRVESFFDPGTLADVERTLGMSPGQFTPRNVVVYVCGLTGTIRETLTRLIERGFIPGVAAIRDALGISREAKSSLFFEDYATEPVIDVRDPAAVEPLRARMQQALTRDG